VKKLGTKSAFLLEQLKKALTHLRASKKTAHHADRIEDDISNFFADKRRKLYRIQIGRSKEKKPKSTKDFEKGKNPKIIACRKNGQLGGIKRAMNNSKDKLKEWSRSAGNSTKARYGQDFYKYIVGKRWKKKSK
jgi:hypothetical protein